MTDTNKQAMEALAKATVGRSAADLHDFNLNVPDQGSSYAFDNHRVGPDGRNVRLTDDETRAMLADLQSGDPQEFGIVTSRRNASDTGLFFGVSRIDS